MEESSHPSRQRSQLGLMAPAKPALRDAPDDLIHRGRDMARKLYVTQEFPVSPPSAAGNPAEQVGGYNVTPHAPWQSSVFRESHTKPVAPTIVLPRITKRERAEDDGYGI
ncbi:unnamed protein product [Lota lota]